MSKASISITAYFVAACIAFVFSACVSWLARPSHTADIIIFVVIFLSSKEILTWKLRSWFDETQ